MKKSAAIVVLFFAFVTTMVSFKKADPARFENLKVLPKNTNKQQMDSVMKHFTASLGVKCNFCHVRKEDEKKDWDFASDANGHKLVARDMMRMTTKINKKYFKLDRKDGDNMQQAADANAITCFTCHNGNEEPARFPAPKPRS